MQTIIFVLLTLSCLFGSSQCAKCPTFCVCHIWKRFLRVDCVGQGLLDVRVGLDNADGNKGMSIIGFTSPIKVLDLSHNSISSLKVGAFNSDNLAHLEALHLSHNSIAHISASALQGLGHLKLLDLSYNRLRRNQVVSFGNNMPHSALLFAQLFQDSPNLRALRLGFNPLENEYFHGKTSIQDGEAFLIAPKLEFLDLGSCHLGHIDTKSFVGLESLKMLNLSDNQLISLSPLALDKMKNLEELSLQANPWPCDQAGDMQILENWLSSKKFHPACPEKKFEKLIELNPKPSGPQKAKDDHALLYYYRLLGIVNEEEDLNYSHIPKIQHSDFYHPDDVEVFDKKAVNPLRKPFEELSNVDANFSSETDVMYKLHCSVESILLFWFIFLSFLAGLLVSFLCTFLYFAEPCSVKGCCSQVFEMIQRNSSSTSRRMHLNRVKSLSRGERFASLVESDSDHGEDRLSLINRNEGEHENMGLTTPVLSRAAASTRRTQTPPPTYDEHLALHVIRVDG